MADPTIYGRDESGLMADGSGGVDSNMFGPLGDPDFVTIHHSAGPRAPARDRCRELNRAYQKQHMLQGWGDIGYHFCMDDLGRFYRLRSTKWKGAHVGGWNSHNIGIMLHGNYVFNELTDAQNASLKWLFRGGFYQLFGETEAGIHAVRGHQEWPGHGTNACPGTNLMRHLAWLRDTETF